nr:CRISPR-associated protein Cas5 [Nocardiopsis mwathae]
MEITITAPVVSFRNPLYAGVQVTLPCPAPSTVAGLLASTVGGWDAMPLDTRVGVAFHARGQGTDLETYHPLDAKGAKTTPNPKDREFLADATLTLWFIDHLEMWEKAIRRPVWPLRFGRSQDLASGRARCVSLQEESGRQGHALLPAPVSRSGPLLRMPQAISRDRARTRWGTYRYATSGSSTVVESTYSTETGQAVVLLDGLHPDTIAQSAR